MKVFTVVGPSDSGKTTVVAELARRLDERGEVATVKRLTHEPDVDTEGKDTARHRAGGASHTVGLTDDGTWFATGDRRTIDDVLSGFAPDYDYCIVEGFSDSDLPKVALGERQVAEPILVSASSDKTLSVDSALDAIEGIEPFETLPSLVADVKRSADAEYAGAIATFTGRVRVRDGPDDPPTKHLEFERYDSLAADRMTTIREELCERDGIQTVRLHHRTGVVEAGEDIVFVVVLAGHREEAFEAVSDGIDRLKEEVPLFKKEVTVEDEFWRHERTK